MFRDLVALNVGAFKGWKHIESVTLNGGTIPTDMFSDTRLKLVVFNQSTVVAAEGCIPGMSAGTYQGTYESREGKWVKV